MVERSLVRMGVCAVLGCFLVTASALGDLRVEPPKRKKKEASFELVVKVGSENKVIIPGTAARSSSIFSQSNNMIAGLAISLAFVSLVFVVRGKRHNSAVAVLIVSIGLFGMTQYVAADIRVEQNKAKPVQVKVVGGGRGKIVTIQLTKSMIDKLARDARRAPRGETSAAPRSEKSPAPEK